MLSLNERKHLSSTFKFDPRPKPSSPTLLPKGEGSKLSKYMAQTPTDFNFLIREVCQHPLPKGARERGNRFLREHRLSHQILVNSLCGTSSIRNGPNDQRLAPGHVARGEDFRHTGHLVLIHLNIAALVNQHSQLRQ